MTSVICNKAKECKSETCGHKKPHEIKKIPIQMGLGWSWINCTYSNPNMHPFDPCRNARCITKKIKRR